MKRLITTLFILGLIITIGVLELVSVQNTMHTLEKNISTLHDEVITNEGDITIFSDKILALKDKWEKDEGFICLMFNHKDLLPITESITRAYANIKNNNFDDTIIELNLLEEYTKTSAHVMDFHINNIL